MHNARCPEILCVSAELSENLFYVIFHPCTHMHAHTHPTLFLRRVEAGDSSARIVAPAMEGNRDVIENKL